MKIDFLGRSNLLKKGDHCKFVAGPDSENIAFLHEWFPFSTFKGGVLIYRLHLVSKFQNAPFLAITTFNRKRSARFSNEIGEQGPATAPFLPPFETQSFLRRGGVITVILQRIKKGEPSLSYMS